MTAPIENRAQLEARERAIALFSRLESLSYTTRGSAGAMPLSLNGDTDYGLAFAIATDKDHYGQDGSAMIYPAIEYAGLRRGDELPVDMFLQKTLQIPEIDSSIQFDELPFEGVAHSSATTKEMIRDRLMQAESIGNGTVYAPYYDLMGNQVDVTGGWQNIYSQLVTELNGEAQEPTLELLDAEALITGSFAAVYKVPTSVPVSSTKNDTAEPGSTNLNYIGSSIKGDSGNILASYGDYYYIRTGSDLHGWVRKSDVASIDTETKKQLEDNEVFYARGIPFRYAVNGEVKYVRPGDSLYRIDGRIITAEPDASGEVGFFPVEEMTEASCVSQITTPDEFIDFIYRVRESYKWGDMDCAKIVTRAMRMMHEQVPEAFSNITDHFLHKKGLFDLAYTALKDQEREEAYELARQNHFIEPGIFDTLAPGIYLADMGGMTEDQKYNPVHGFTIVVDSEGRLQAHSIAFAIRDENMNTTYPVGPVVSSKEVLQKYMTERGIKFRLVQIASKTT